MSAADPERELRELVARVTRAVTLKAGAGAKAQPQLASIVATEVAAALAAGEREPARPAAGAAGPLSAREALARVETCASCLEDARRRSGKRAVVTTTGKNARGVVAKIAQAIADAGGDIVDISQTLVSDYFTMIIVVDTSALEVPFVEFKARLVRAVGALGAECLVMHEDVVTALQRSRPKGGSVALWESSEVREVLRMIESESLDVRAVTMGNPLRDTATDSLDRTCARIHEKLMRTAERLVATTAAVHADFAVPITNTRLSVTPLALVTEPCRAANVAPAAITLDRAARELGVDYIGGFSALVEKGMTAGDQALIASIPEALASTERVCSSVNGGLLGEAYVQEVSRFRGDGFIMLAGRIPAPLLALAELMRAAAQIAVAGGAALALLLTVSGGRTPAAQPDPVPVPAPADKALAVRLSSFRLLAGAPPAGWEQRGFDDSQWVGPAGGPFAPRPVEPPPAGPALPGVTYYDGLLRAPLLLRGTFDVAEPQRVRVLELRIAHADGFIAYVNGREVARRGLGSGPLGAARPALLHGPEVEHVYLPVPSAALPRLDGVGNVLAIVVLPYSGRSALVPTAPSASVEVAAASGVRIVRGPYLIAPTQGRHGAGVSVAWETDLPAAGAVMLEAGDAAAAGSGPAAHRYAADVPSGRQVVALKDLASGRAYGYQVTVDGGRGDTAETPRHRFETLPAAPHPLRFAVYGDMRYPGHAAHRAVVEGLVREAPAVIFNTGDPTDMGSEESNWQRYFEITAPMGAIAPVVPALGNHDAARAGLGAARSWGLFGLPSDAPAGTPPGWTSLDLGGVHFIILNTNAMASPAQKARLADDLARARSHHARAIFAFCHEGPWAHGLHGTSSMMARDYAPLLARAGVDVLFSGHDHIYERGTGVTPSGKLTYVITGGGGAPLYNPSCRAASGPPPGDVPRPLPTCPASVTALTKAFHYIIVEVADAGITVCPRHPDGSPVEPCVSLPRKQKTAKTP